MRGALLIAAAALAALGAGACFSPEQPGCAFSCAQDQLCPDGYVCQSDGFCHRADGKGTCTLDAPDGGGGDGGAEDGL
jgi:hypothetical protein